MMRTRPKTQAEFVALARAMAQSDSFKNAEQIYCALLVWPDEVDQWWNQDLAANIDALCHGNASKR
ncbi:hypothetical protein ATE48_07400 [Candidatus Viadribacter manganicus]|uniref:Uncharacterized protein n=1 Tax=Candidatus Viadribacter manganicus TaxID=1759059 RepID=A0A1B1AGS5_9PROT|nr:hypothetical protein ATE48_07400 [Candidatus Viadribacter manganicus]